MKPTNLQTVTLGELPDLVAMMEDKIRNADRALAQILGAEDLSEAANIAQAAKEELCWEGPGRRSTCSTCKHFKTERAGMIPFCSSQKSEDYLRHTKPEYGCEFWGDKSQTDLVTPPACGNCAHWKRAMEGNGLIGLCGNHNSFFKGITLDQSCNCLQWEANHA